MATLKQNIYSLKLTKDCWEESFNKNGQLNNITQLAKATPEDLRAIKTSEVAFVKDANAQKKDEYRQIRRNHLNSVQSLKQTQPDAPDPSAGIPETPRPKFK